MIRKLLFIGCMLLSLLGYSQIDTGTKPMAIPLGNKPKSQKPPDQPKPAPAETTVEIQKPIKMPKPAVAEKKDNFSMIPQDEFVNPGKPYVDKLNKKLHEELDYSKYISMPIGDYETGSPYVIMHVRDHVIIDGDRIQIRSNERIILSGIQLDADFQTLRVNLKSGSNTIDVIALNDGLRPGNTAEYEIYDADGQLLAASSWVLSPGYKAVITIVKH